MSDPNFDAGVVRKEIDNLNEMIVQANEQIKVSKTALSTFYHVRSALAHSIGERIDIPDDNQLNLSLVIDEVITETSLGDK